MRLRRPHGPWFSRDRTLSDKEPVLTIVTFLIFVDERVVFTEPGNTIMHQLCQAKTLKMQHISIDIRI